MTNSLKKLTLVVLLLAASFCCAQPGPSPQNWDWPLCPNPGANEAFALGNRDVATGATIDEFDDGLEISTAVFPALCVLDYTYTTAVAHNVQSLHLHVGSGLDIAQEWLFIVDATLPNGKHYRARMQYDKHAANGSGNEELVFPVSWSLPVGTAIRLRRPAVTCIGIPTEGIFNPNPYDTTLNRYLYDSQRCETGQNVTFIGR